MANSKRRYIDKNGNMFMPMNMEGGSWNEHFMTTPKLVTLGVIIFTLVALIAWLRSRYAAVSAYITIMTIYIAVAQHLIRYVIFEEKFYYKMYKTLKQSEITTPAIFWDIASIKETEDGALMTYADGKIGIMMKLERDTITGKNQEFKEEHYDAISDFYKDIADKKYNFVQMNIMEQAGNDPRLAELDKLIHKSDNPNIVKLMEKQVGHIKNITHKTLYESDYIIVYTKDLTKIDDIINDTTDSVYKILDGAFISFKVLKSRDIIEFIKEEYGVKYFNYTEATLSMFKNHGILTRKPFELDEIVFSTGETQKLGSRELNVINKLTSGVLNGTIDIEKISIKDTIYSNKNKDKFEGIDFDSLSDGFESVHQNNTERVNGIKGFTKRKKNDNPKDGEFSSIENEGNSEFDIFEIHSDYTSTNLDDDIISKNQQKNNDKGMDLGSFSDEGESIDF